MATSIDVRPHLDVGTRTARFVRPLAWASIVANVLIVVTGGAVRLSGSGLGCETWPRCNDGQFRPHGELHLHTAIEFGNRMLTFALTAVAIATLVVMWRTGRRDLRVLAAVLFLAIPLQAVVGGISVLTDLNPWVVSLHLLISMAMIGVAVVLLRRLDQGPVRAPLARGAMPSMAWAVFACTWVVLYLGTVVTGSGPHAGDTDAPRNGLDPEQLSQLHADSVFLLVGLSIGLMVALRLPGIGFGGAAASDAGTEAQRAAVVLVVVELAQGLIGFVQYFTGLPEVLVGAHMLGASVISGCATWALLAVVAPRPAVADAPVADVVRG